MANWLNKGLTARKNKPNPNTTHFGNLSLAAGNLEVKEGQIAGIPNDCAVHRKVVVQS